MFLSSREVGKYFILSIAKFYQLHFFFYIAGSKSLKYIYRFKINYCIDNFPLYKSREEDFYFVPIMVLIFPSREGNPQRGYFKIWPECEI